MRPLDTSAWNLIPAVLLLAGACATRPSIPVDETEAGDESGDGDGDGDPTGDGDGDPTGDGDSTDDSDGDPTDDDDDPTGDGECNPPCGAHQFCVDGEYCYSIPPDPECAEHFDCDPGEYCENYLDQWEANCSPLEPIPECEAPELVEIPLPAEAQGMILDLELTDLDAAGSDELVLLKPGELLVVRSDQSVSSHAVNLLVEELAVVRANDDEVPDVLLTSSTPDAAQLLLGNGDGTFAAASSLTLPGLLQPRAIDWMPGGAQELVAIDFDTRAATLVSELAGAVIVEALPVVDFNNTQIDAVHVVDSVEPTVALRSGCFVGFQSTFGWVGELFHYTQGCTSEHEPSDELFVMVTVVEANTSLRTYNLFGELEKDAVITGSVGDLATVTELGVVSAGPAMTRLLIPQQQSFSCVANLESLPIASRVVAGDIADNPGEEFVLLGQGQLTAWGRP